jgi:hypothetical protein
MSDLIRLPTDPKAKAASDAALAQMFGYYDFDWHPFTPALLPGVKQAA